jgi:hypothetical protein
VVQYAATRYGLEGLSETDGHLLSHRLGGSCLPFLLFKEVSKEEQGPTEAVIARIGVP